MIEDNINLTIKVTTSHKVVVSWVLEGESMEGEAAAEVGEEVGPGNVVGVDIGVTAEKVGGIREFGADLINMGFKINKGRNK